MSSWILSRAPIEQYRLGKLSLIHDAQSIYLYAESTFQVFQTAHGFFLLSGYVLPRCSEDLAYSDTKDLVQSMWAKYGLNWKNHIKGVYNLVAFFDDQWIVLNDTLGLSKIYWTSDGRIVSNSFDLLAGLVEDLTWNQSALLSRQYFHRDIGEITIVKNIKKSRSGIQFLYRGDQFQHDYYFDYFQLKNHPIESSWSPTDFVVIWEKVFQSMDKVQANANHVITLTGGKDARTGLALLKYFGKNVIGLTYGVPNSKDAVFASRLAKKANLVHVIPPLLKSKEQWYDQVLHCIDVDSSFISPHRALRGHAFHEVFSGSQFPWYWGGYMGGEWLMGLYPDGLVFPKWLTEFKVKQSIADIVFCDDNDFGDIDDLVAEVQRIQKKVDQVSDSKSLQFIWMFEIGVLHHAQDIELAAVEGAYPYPFMMDVDFIQKLFRSKYSFFFQDHSTRNLLKRWKLYEWNIRIQQSLMPQWGNVPFGKKGEYTPNVFLKGSLFWSIYKAVHYLFEKKSYPSSFSYPEEWRAMYLEFFQLAEESGVPFYSKSDISHLKDQLMTGPLPRLEKSWMSFSRLVLVYLQYIKICRLRNGSQNHPPQK